MNYNNRKPLSKRVIREQTKGQSVLEIQIVYKTKSDLKVIVMLQRYIIFCFTANLLPIKCIIITLYIYFVILIPSH